MSELHVLTLSKTPPFLIADDAGCSEDLRLTYRYMDIRRNPIKNSLILRNQVSQGMLLSESVSERVNECVRSCVRACVSECVSERAS